MTDSSCPVPLWRLDEGIPAIVTGATSGIGRCARRGKGRRGDGAVAAGRDACREPRAQLTSSTFASASRRAVAIGLAARGASVVLACRDVAAAERVAAEARAAHLGSRVCAAPVALELSSPSSVRAFARAWGARPLRLLVNCAGAQVGDLARINHLGPYLLTRLLERGLAAGRPSRVVFVASVTHRHADWIELERWAAAADAQERAESEAGVGGGRGSLLDGLPELSYGATKLANVLTAFELERRLTRRSEVARAASPEGSSRSLLATSGVGVAAVDPGVAMTGIWKSPSYSRGAAKRLLDLVGDSPESAAQSVLHVCCLEDWEADRDAAERAREEVVSGWRGTKRGGGERDGTAEGAVELDPGESRDGAVQRRGGDRKARQPGEKRETSASPPPGDDDPAPAPPSMPPALPLSSQASLRYYARGLFGAFPATLPQAYPPRSARGLSPRWARLAAAPAFLLDTWARRVAGAGARTHVCAAAPAAYDPDLARRVWDASARVLGLSPDLDGSGPEEGEGEGGEGAAGGEETDWFARG